MLPDDVYKTRLRATVAELESWLATLVEHASLDIGHDEASWRVAILPRAAEACPVELVLRVDQRFDIAIGPETYEDQSLEPFYLFQSLLAAVATGRVITRTWSTSATATPVRIETIIMPADGTMWVRARSLDQTGQSGQSGANDLLKCDRHYAPYARGA